jgi:hypothetical protein
VKAAQPLIPKTAEAIWGLWQQRMYTRVVADLYSEEWLAVSRNSGRHSIRFHKPRISEETRCRLVFGVVAFPPPPVTNSGNEAQARRLERLTATSRPIISSKHDCVFIRRRSG